MTATDITMSDAREVLSKAESEILAIVQRTEAELGRCVGSISLLRDYTQEELATTRVSLFVGI